MRGSITPRAATVAEVLRRARLRHVRRRQVAPRPDARVLGRRPVRQLAAAEGLRPLLRLPAGRDRPVLPRADRRQPPHRPARRVPRTATTSARTSSTSRSDWIRDLTSVRPDRPFFLYLAFGATHAPHQAPQRLPRQVPRPLRRRLGRRPRALVRAPARARHRPRGHDARAAQSRRAAVGRPVREPSASSPRACRRRSPRSSTTPTRRSAGSSTSSSAQGQLDNTLLMLLSDNGASQEGGPFGVMDEFSFFNLPPGGPRRHRRQPARRHRRPALAQQHPVGLGAGRQHAAALVQAEHLRRRRPRSADRALAGRHRRSRRRSATSSATRSTSPRRSSTSPASTLPEQFHGARADPDARARASRRPGTPPMRRRRARASTSRWAATAASASDGWKAVTYHQQGDAVRRRRVGAVPPRRGLLGVPRPRRRAPREAARAGRRLVGRGRRQRRAAARRPRHRAVRRHAAAGHPARPQRVRLHAADLAHPRRRGAAARRPRRGRSPAMSMSPAGGVRGRALRPRQPQRRPDVLRQGRRRCSSTTTRSARIIAPPRRSISPLARTSSPPASSATDRSGTLTLAVDGADIASIAIPGSCGCSARPASTSAATVCRPSSTTTRDRLRSRATLSRVTFRIQGQRDRADVAARTGGAREGAGRPRRCAGAKRLDSPARITSPICFGVCCVAQPQQLVRLERADRPPPRRGARCVRRACSSSSSGREVTLDLPPEQPPAPRQLLRDDRLERRPQPRHARDWEDRLEEPQPLCIDALDAARQIGPWPMSASRARCPTRAIWRSIATRSRRVQVVEVAKHRPPRDAGALRRSHRRLGAGCPRRRGRAAHRRPRSGCGRATPAGHR